MSFSQNASAAYGQNRTLPSASAAYYAWLRRCLAGLERELPRISRSADAAAEKFVREDYQLASWGDGAFDAEFSGRAGGLMPITRLIGANADPRRTIILVPLCDDRIPDQLARIEQFKANGNMVIVFGRRSVLRGARRLGGRWDFAIANHAASRGGLFRSNDGSSYIPTDPVANIAALWTWTGEFVGACRRLGKMPTMWQSIRVSGSQERNAKYRDKRWYHEGIIIPSPAGSVGREYLRKLRENLALVYEKEAPSVRQASALAVSALKEKHNCYLFPLGHALRSQQTCAHDPRLFKSGDSNTEAKKGDVFLCISYDRVYSGPEYDGFADMEKAHRAGASFIWSFTDYNQAAVKAIPAGDIWINQHWAMGDAVVSLPGYDVKILPTSGVIDESLFWMINADMFQAITSAGKQAEGGVSPELPSDRP